MNRKLSLLFLTLIFGAGTITAQRNPGRTGESLHASQRDAAIVLSSASNAVHFRLFTNASPDAPKIFNTIEIEAYGKPLLKSPGRDDLKRLPAGSPPPTSLDNVLINGLGPELRSENGARVIEQISGPQWNYVALDLSAAYRDRLNEFKRAVLFVAPDLFIVYDHLAAREPIGFEMFLHPPANTDVDKIWGDLRFDSPTAGFQIHAPARRKSVRSWKRIDSLADSILPGTLTVQLAPTNKVTQLDVLTVFAVYQGSTKTDYAFRLLESNTAVGARIHRDGLPTLIAFRTDATNPNPNLLGFGFKGSAGVDVFKPKKEVRNSSTLHQ